MGAAVEPIFVILVLRVSPEEFVLPVAAWNAVGFAKPPGAHIHVCLVPTIVAAIETVGSAFGRNVFKVYQLLFSTVVA